MDNCECEGHPPRSNLSRSGTFVANKRRRIAAMAEAMSQDTDTIRPSSCTLSMAMRTVRRAARAACRPQRAAGSA